MVGDAVSLEDNIAAAMKLISKIEEVGEEGTEV